jgi:DNA-binding beta-propeller fold protein YncE
MGTRERSLVAAFSAGLVAVAATASAAPGLRIALVRGPGQPTAGDAVTVIVRTAAHANVKVWIARASVSRSFRAKPLTHGRYRASVVFPKAGRWTFGARAGGARVRLGSVSVRPRPVPLTFAWPTSVDVEPDGSLLVAENGNQSGNGRVDRIDPATGKSVEIAEVDQAYSVAHAPSGAIYLSAGTSLLQLDGAGGTTPVARAAGDIGPIAVASSGDVYYATGTQVFRVAGGTGAPLRIDGKRLGAVSHVFYDPYAVAAAPDGSLYVVDTAAVGRLYRVAPDGTTTAVSRSG